jgi:hypothetical protein
VTQTSAAALDRICDFLEVARKDFTADAARLSIQDARGGVRPKRGLIGNLYPVLYVTAARHLLQPIKRLIGVRRAESIKRRLRLRQLSEMLFFERSYEKLDQIGRAKLWEYFAQDFQSLKELVAKDLSLWTAAGVEDGHETGILK